MIHINAVITMFILCMVILITKANEEDSHNYFDIGTTDHHDSHDHDHDHVHESDIGRAIGITIFAGCASFLGAFVIFCIKKEYVGIMPASLAFSAGVTIHLTFVSLIPECVELLYHVTNEESEAIAELYALLCVIGGILLIIAMETVFHKVGVNPHNHSEPTATTTTECVLSESAQGVSAVDSDIDAKENASTYGAIAVESPQKIKDAYVSHSNYSHVSYSVAFALILHHFPEGIATFVSLVYDFEFGILVALALALHDIPSGVCIGVPCYLATNSMKRPFILCLIAAVTYPLGALVGWAIIETADEEFSDAFIAVLFGITAGIILYISFVELLPTAIIAANQFKPDNNNKNKGCSHCSVSGMSITLLFIGFLVMAISNILLKAVGGHDH